MHEVNNWNFVQEIYNDNLTILIQKSKTSKKAIKKIKKGRDYLILSL